MPCPDDRKPNQIRSLSFKRKYTRSARLRVGEVRTHHGALHLLHRRRAAPDFLTGKGQGWLTAEYGMLPGSTNTCKARDKGGKVDGRSVEIQRLIGRSLRAAVDLSKLGERTLWVDCDVIEADGGTRTAAINGAFVAIVDAVQSIKRDLACSVADVIPASVAAVSVGIVEGEERLDLEYVEDRDAEVDLNLVMTGAGKFIEVQGSGEESTFTRKQLDKLLELGEAGIRAITAEQKKSLGTAWPA
ncbi:MAG: ribonuclease PH [Gemmataceae bacterium]